MTWLRHTSCSECHKNPTSTLTLLRDCPAGAEPVSLGRFFRKWWGALRRVKIVERSIEGVHSRVHKMLLQAPATGCPTFSVELKWPGIEANFLAHPRDTLSIIHLCVLILASCLLRCLFFVVLCAVVEWARLSELIAPSSGNCC
jgi:hypothetical protein